MPAATVPNRPLEMFEALCHQQGRKKSWVASKAGLTVQGLSKRFSGKRGYSWQPGEQKAIADALGVPVTFLWQDAKPAQDCDDVTT